MGEGKILSFEMTDTPTSVLISHAEIFDFCCSCCTKYLVYQYMKYVLRYMIVRVQEGAGGQRREYGVCSGRTKPIKCTVTGTWYLAGSANNDGTLVGTRRPYV